MTKLITLVAIIGMVRTAQADITVSGLRDDTKVNPCGPVKKKVQRKRPPTPAKPRPPIHNCDCPQGPQGEPGEKGEKGDPGISQIIMKAEVIELEVRAKPALRLRLGAMGTLQGPHGDWAWGPALQLATDLSDKYELAFSAGLAAGASEGRESGHLLQLTVERVIDESFGVIAGLNYTEIDGSKNNGHIDGSYLGVHAGGVAKIGGLRAEVALTAGGLEDDFESGTQLAFGIQTNIFYGLSW